MTLQSSGAISFANINTELGVSSTTTRSLNDSASRTLAGVASGAISMSNFYGKSSVLISITNQGISSFGSGTREAWYYVTGGGKIQYSVAIGGGSPIDLETWCTPTTETANYEVKVTVTGGTLYGASTSTWLALSGGTRSWYGQSQYSGDTQVVTFTVEIRKVGETTVLDSATITFNIDEY